MEEIINKLIDIDNMSKGIINKVEEKNLNIDELIENELDKQKTKIDVAINVKLKVKREELDSKFKEFKSNLDTQTNKKIEQINYEYQNFKKKKVENIVTNIINN